MTETNRHSLPRPSAALAAAVALCIGAGGCGTDGVSVPQPVPVPKVSLLRFSPPKEAQTRVLIIGLEGAVAGVGRVEAIDTASGARALAPTTSTGTFAVLVEATTPSGVELRFVTDLGRSDPAPLAQPRVLGGPVLGRPNSNGSVLAPDARGNVVVSNDGGAGQPLLLSATPDSIVHLANPRTGALASTTTDAIGRFSVTIAASSGDVLQLVLSDPQDPSATSNYLSLPVP